MEFDKSKVFTAVNADDLPLRSLCIFANTVESLRKAVQHEAGVTGDSEKEFVGLHNNGGDDRFVAGGYTYNYAYLIKLPITSPYKPFKRENILDAVQQHGMWVKEKISGDLALVSGITNLSNGLLTIRLGSSYYTAETFLNDFVFADDGSPCGEETTP